MESSGDSVLTDRQDTYAVNSVYAVDGAVKNNTIVDTGGTVKQVP